LRIILKITLGGWMMLPPMSELLKTGLCPDGQGQRHLSRHLPPRSPPTQKEYTIIIHFVNSRLRGFSQYHDFTGDYVPGKSRIADHLRSFSSSVLSYFRHFVGFYSLPPAPPIRTQSCRKEIPIQTGLNISLFSPAPWLPIPNPGLSQHLRPLSY